MCNKLCYFVKNKGTLEVRKGICPYPLSVLYYNFFEVMNQGKLSHFLCEPKSVSEQDVLIVVACPSQWTETMLSKLASFPYIPWYIRYLSYIVTNHG